jgi:hypothetical protein
MSAVLDPKRLATEEATASPVAKPTGKGGADRYLNLPRFWR